MLTASLLMVALGLLCWPASLAARRLARLSSRSRPLRRVGMLSGRRRITLPASVVLAMGCGVAVLGIAVPVALGLLAGAAWWHRRAQRRTQAAVAATAGVAEAVGALGDELRAGVHPAVAAESVAMESSQRTAIILRTVAAAERHGGEPNPDTDFQCRNGIADEVLGQLVHCWVLARRHGLPLAGVLEAVRRDAEAVVRLARQVDAKLAGPRASAAVLAALPLAGVALGEAMGAQPVRVLSSTPVGQVLLVAGALLVFAGVVWSAALTARVLAR
ncbi:Flp pilus assembly protein TadB [Saccharomonospora marina XMU15]|uniref:Flp pilus assembly protein TadB n=2 Tax=Saccharomonospora TaxID=1851 RepID=H5X256_9PSEU|nr:Flp pilus assembly protein TadB [Saccharomonospora marina XMU15]